MALLIVIFIFVILFSLLTVGELLLLKRFGFDIIAHLKVTHSAGNKKRFFFEAFGVVAFVLGQPIILMILTVWAYGQVNPMLHEPIAAITDNLNKLILQ